MHSVWEAVWDAPMEQSQHDVSAQIGDTPWEEVCWEVSLPAGRLVDIRVRRLVWAEVFSEAGRLVDIQVRRHVWTEVLSEGDP
jgi:hypothetical protein